MRKERGTSLLELVLALAMMGVVFTAVVPLFGHIRQSSDVQGGAAEAIQNGRVLMDHLQRHLSCAAEVLSVSDATTTLGHFEYLDNDANTLRYEVSGGYVYFGEVGSLSLLAGPVSQLQFSCYGVADLTAATTDTYSIRLVTVETTVTNASAGPDKSLRTSVFLGVDQSPLVAWWTLDETAGTTAADSSRYENHGTLQNMAGSEWTAGVLGGALGLNGSSHYVDLGTASSLNFAESEPFTVAAWMKTTEDYGAIVSFRSSTDGGPVIDMAVGYDGVTNNAGKAMILVRQDGSVGGEASVTGPSVNDGTWHHLAAIRNAGSTIEWFVDGVSQGTHASTASGGAITTDLRAIGSERRWVGDGYGSADQRYFAGAIDDVRVYSRALDTQDLLELTQFLRYRGFNETQVDSDATSLVISTPSANEDDLLIAAIATDGDTSSSLAAPSGHGWTLIDLGVYNSAVTLGVWWKTAGVSEPASHTFAWSDSQQAYGWMMRFSGQSLINPINDWSAHHESSSMPISPTVTSIVDDCLILRLGAFDGNDVTSTPEPGNPGLSGHTAITMETSGSHGPLGRWRLDETSGTLAGDTSGNGNHGTLTHMAGTEWTTGQRDGALAFDGSNDYVDLGTPSLFNFGPAAPFTVAAWVKTTEDYGMVVSFRRSTDGGPVIDMAIGYNGVTYGAGRAMILVRQDGGLSGPASVTGSLVNDGTWHHCAVTRGSGSTIEWFVDGVSQGTHSGTESGGAITTDLRAIGSERRWVGDSYGSADQRYLAGTIDDVRIYGTALDAVEIGSIYSGTEASGSGDPVSGGAGYVKQSNAGSSGASSFSLTAASDAQTLTIAIAPN